MSRIIVISTMLLVLFSQSITLSLPAFPGAEGGGALSVGGRGGNIYEVSNLNNSGAGSLREGCLSSGPRIIVFRIGGTIKVSSTIHINNPFITIAGQTAPGGGICISGENISNSPVSVGTHDVVIRYIRIRKGKEPNPGEEDAISIGEGESYNIIIDHCSFSWSNDETVSIWADNGITHSMTFSYNIISEGLNHSQHSTGLIVGSNTMCEEMDQFTVHHNLFMHNRNRNPYLKVKDQQIINNIIYNYGWLGTQIAGGGKFDIIGNLYKEGPDNTGRSEIVCRLENSWNNCNLGLQGNPSIYIKGNKGPHQSNPEGDQWNTMLEQTHGWSWPNGQQKRLNQSFQRDIPMDEYSMYPVTVNNVENLELMLLNNVGASKKLNELGEWIDARDAVDTRLINEYKQGSGSIINDETEVGGFPSLAMGTPYDDSDHDGMADQWEGLHGFNSNSDSDGTEDEDNDGYTNIEEFLNGTNPNDVTEIWANGKLEYKVKNLDRLTIYSVTGRKIPNESINSISGMRVFIISKENSTYRYLLLNSKAMKIAEPKFRNWR